MDFGSLFTFLSMVVLGACTGYVGYCTGRQQGKDEGFAEGFYQRGFYDEVEFCDCGEPSCDWDRR